MPFTFADYRSSFIVHLKRMWVEKYESLCAAVGIPGDDTWDVAEANPGADVWPSVALLSIRVPPWASAIAKKFMEQNPSIPTGSAVRALADLISKAATWLHSQKKIWRGLYNNGTTMSTCSCKHALTLDLDLTLFNPHRLAFVVRFNELPRCPFSRAGGVIRGGGGRA